MNKISGISRPAENWTKFPNCILDNLGDFAPSELKVLCLMVRKNLGYDNPNKKFSLEYIVKKIKMAKPTVNNAIKNLISKNCIIKIGVVKNTFCYEINWVEPAVKKLYRLNNLTGTGKEIEPVPVKNFNLLKDNKVKENRVKENKDDLIQIPDNLVSFPGFLDAWYEWIEYKKEIKNKITPISAKRQLKFLSIQPDPKAVIFKSIENGWKGLFEIKNNSNNKTDKMKKTYNSVIEDIDNGKI